MIIERKETKRKNIALAGNRGSKATCQTSIKYMHPQFKKLSSSAKPRRRGIAEVAKQGNAVDSRSTDVPNVSRVQTSKGVSLPRRQKFGDKI